MNHSKKTAHATIMNELFTVSFKGKMNEIIIIFDFFPDYLLKALVSFALLFVAFS